jgi:hypothetical protein
MGEIKSCGRTGLIPFILRFLRFFAAVPFAGFRLKPNSEVGFTEDNKGNEGIAGIIQGAQTIPARKLQPVAPLRSWFPSVNEFRRSR